MITFLKNLNKPYVCVFDLEHNVDGELLQFAAIMLKNVGTNLYQVNRSINFYVRQENSDFYAEGGRYVLDETQEHGVSPQEGLELFESFFADFDPEDIMIVSHGVHQDCLVLRENGYDVDRFEHKCTYKLAKKVLNRQTRLRLKDITNDCGLASIHDHNAYSDALSTLFALSFLLKKEGEI